MMSKPLLIAGFLLLGFFKIELAQAQSAQVWATISNIDDVPVVGSDGTLFSSDSVLNSYLQSLRIFSCERAIPASKRRELQQVYELSCHCPITELQATLSSQVPALSRVERAPKFDTLHTPNDYTLTSYVNNYALNLINAPAAWDLTKGDTNVVLAISDQGYDPLHSELMGKYVFLNSGSPFTTHGSAVAITASGNTNNNNGLSSIGYNCRLGLYPMSYNEVINSAYAGARVINLSWSSGCFYNPYEQMCVDEAFDAGAFLIAAAGNGGTCGFPSAYVYPAAYNHVFAVTSIGEFNQHEQVPNDTTSTHQHNDLVDLSAPGYLVAVNPAEGWYINSSGTSWAAPLVTGTVGLMLSINPCLSRKDIDTLLRLSAFPIDSINPAYAGKLGAGRLDAHAAVQLAAGWATQPMMVTTQPVTVSTPAGTTAQFSALSSSSFPVYQWQRDSSGVFVNLVNNSTYSGVHTPTLVISNVTASFNNQQFRCVMTSGYCQAISNPASLLVSGAVLPQAPDTLYVPSVACFADTTYLSVDTVSFATGYNWSFTGNVSIISGQGTNAVAVYIFETTTIATVTPYNANGSGNSISVPISTLPMPTGFLSGNPTICAGDSAVLTLNVTGQGPWLGMINDSIPFSGSSNPIQVVVAPDLTTFYVLQTLQTLDGCDAFPDYLSSTANVMVLPYNSDTVLATVCSGQLPYLWNGMNISSSGFYLDTIPGITGCDTIRTLQLTVIGGNVPAAPASIQRTLVSNSCFNRVYRYTAAVTNNAAGYQWTIPSSCGGIPGVTVDSGNVNSSRVIKLSYYSNAAAWLTDSIRVRAYNSCGYGPKRSAKLNNAALNVPPLPSITVTPLVTNVCGGRKYRYAAPNFPLPNNSTAAATGYNWSFSIPNTLLPVIDSGTTSSKIIVVKYLSNDAAATGDSIYLQFTSACGYSAKRALKLAIAKLNTPSAPSSITVTALSTSVCGARKYRLSMPNLPLATNTAAAATGYLWSFAGIASQFTFVDSGTLTSKVVVIRYTSNSATILGDSIVARYNSNCGYSEKRAVKFSVPNLSVPLAPVSIKITPVAPSACGARIYRYSAPILPAGTTALALPTGYEWSFTGALGLNAVIDSGTLYSKEILVRYTSNAAAVSGDSIKLRYASSCGYSPYRSAALTNTFLANCPLLFTEAHPRMRVEDIPYRKEGNETPTGIAPSRHLLQ